MADVHAARRERLRERCGALAADAALVTRPANVRYLTGVEPDGAALLLTRDRAVLAVPEDAPSDPDQLFPPADEIQRLEVPPGADPAAAAAA
ncbi:aminopeptidase P family N-terminal domain-containing protein, partial [Streptacidiphilus griseoplanus]|uniref:aminopeptidase P family N-terminal domain-containing protein n=1 Tax=Peterkaempfera griseoplana TaxID=66896 RepID=UPI00158BE96E